MEQLHRYLAQQGYMKARRKPSRYFDEATASAVAAWQEDHGVVPSGSFGHESRQAYLMQLVCSHAAFRAGLFLAIVSSFWAAA